MATTRTIINLNTWERRKNYEFFKTFLNPSRSITSEVDCTEAFLKSKQEKSSFFTKYLYAILRAANEIPEFCYRVEKTADNQDVVVQYNKLSVITPIRVGENGAFRSVSIVYNKNYERFVKSYEEIVASVKGKEADPYAAEEGVKEGTAPADKILVSAVPDLYFTSITYTQFDQNGSIYPLITVGKAIDRGERKVMPIGICVHHGFCDGYHLSMFFKKIEEYLAELGQNEVK